MVGCDPGAAVQLPVLLPYSLVSRRAGDATDSHVCSSAQPGDELGAPAQTAAERPQGRLR